MFELLITIFTGGGAVGLGSIFKMVSGALDSYSQRKELREHSRLLKATKTNKHAMAFQKAMDGGSESITIFTRTTRRMLALGGVFTLAVVTLHCTLFPTETFITLRSVAGGSSEPYSILLGLVEIPRSDKPIYLTLGHIALGNCIGFQMILGYYFTPGGRK